MLAVPAIIHILKMDAHEAHATAKAVILPLTQISGFIYFQSGLIEWNIALKVAAAGVVGSVAGACLLGRISPICLRKIFGTFIFCIQYNLELGIPIVYI